jgi:hypothetical protein
MQAAESNIPLDDLPPIDLDGFHAPESHDNGVDESPASTGPVGQHYGSPLSLIIFLNFICCITQVLIYPVYVL